MSKSNRIRLDWILYILMAVALIGLIIASMRNEIARNPSREAIADLGQYGLVTVQLQTSPYPALPTGTVGLNFMLMDSRRVSIKPDAFTFTYGHEGSDQPVGSGTAQLMSDGSGMLMAGAQFHSVGRWWLRVKVVKDVYEDEVQFTIDVRPAQ